MDWSIFKPLKRKNPSEYISKQPWLVLSLFHHIQALIVSWSFFLKKVLTRFCFPLRNKASNLYQFSTSSGNSPCTSSLTGKMLLVHCKFCWKEKRLVPPLSKYFQKCSQNKESMESGRKTKCFGILGIYLHCRFKYAYNMFLLPGEILWKCWCSGKKVPSYNS